MGTIIETLFINATTDTNVIQYMENLSSDGTVRNIDDFDKLAEIIDEIAFKIACGAAP